MAIKDPSSREEFDHVTTKPANNSRQAALSDTIKNAHATGDGSYGRSDDSVSEKGEDDEVENSGDNSY